ncbi:4064_t:CDS:2 [Paraglomus brasilianum]|uniref:4064_t:CDS:1 n=1 Tax=Paraglomus brasilianum TaxID=144538 RepID=A0A9N9FIS0_9GLOM|nr:4064_t:CDS:2 [Paraglomus brasilianum]
MKPEIVVQGIIQELKNSSISEDVAAGLANKFVVILFASSLLSLSAPFQVYRYYYNFPTEMLVSVNTLLFIA